MKKILVIGGSKGIGYETSRLLANDGHQVHVISRSLPDQKIDSISYHLHDINNANLPTVEGLNGLMFCPGSIRLKPFKMIKPSDMMEEMQLNFFSLVRCLHFYLPYFDTAQLGSIVMFSTVAVQTGMPFHTSIAAAKGAIEGFSRSLAAEVAPGIRVNVIAPSLTNTPLAASLINADAKLKAATERHPLKQIGSSADIASMAKFLLSNESTFITGQVIKIDGGIGSIKLL